MNDPFLLTHCIDPLLFDLGGGFSPASIRDQMLRARLFVDRAVEIGLIGSARRLLIIGAGAAGATAAIRAAQLGVHTVLVEKEPIPFMRQSNCRTRWIDPIQYDWPLDHWYRGTYPWRIPKRSKQPKHHPWKLAPMPLPFQSNIAQWLAIAWTIELNRACHKYVDANGVKFLQVRYRTTVPKPAFNDQTRTLVFDFSPKPEEFGAAGLCTGFGIENCQIGNYSAFAFWDTDPFHKVSCGIKKGPVSVLISGGGDGALQDFLRIVTNRNSAKDIYKAFPTEVTKLIERELQCAEDQAQRAWIWGNTPHHDHNVLQTLHDIHMHAVEKIWNSPGTTINNLVAVIKLILREEFLAGNATVSLAYPCTHFSRCYGLNRFLVLLIIKYLALENRLGILSDCTRVKSVHGVSHQCSNQPATCHGQDHQVAIIDSATCKNPNGSGTEVSVDKHYNVVVIRHGVAPLTFVLNDKSNGKSTAHPYRNLRQVLPYHVSI